jgi:ribosomal protein S18 acetylase RimI-like enzyme
MSIKLAVYNPSLTYQGQKKFDCGHDIINKYVRDSLKQQVKKNLCVAYVLVDTAAGNKFVGLYTLAQHTLSMTQLTALELGSLPKLIPCTRLVMLGVDIAYKGQHLGRRLMADALRVTKEVAQQVGSFGMYLDGDATAVGFYQKLGFILLEGDLSPAPSPMFLPLAMIP